MTHRHWKHNRQVNHFLKERITSMAHATGLIHFVKPYCIRIIIPARFVEKARSTKRIIKNIKKLYSVSITPYTGKVTIQTGYQD